MRSTFARCALLAMLATAAPAARAEQVTGNTTPPAATQPQHAPPTSQPSGFVMVANDPEVDRLVDRLRLSVEQFLKCQPAVRAYGETAASLWAEFQRASEAARRGVDMEQDTPASRAAGAKLAALQNEHRVALLRAREELAGGLRAHIDAKQAIELGETLEEWRGTPGGVARTRARQMLERMTRGVAVSDSQRAAAMKLLGELYLAHNAQVTAAADRCKAVREKLDAAHAATAPDVIELELAMKKALADFDKVAIFDFPGKIAAARPKVIELLTAEQREKIGALTAEECRKLADSYVAARLARYAKVAWSAAQQAMLAELAQAARNAMLTLDPEDQPGYMALSKQLDRDIAALLTIEQRKDVRGGGPVIIRD